MALIESVEKFLTYLQDDKKCSKNTLLAYKRDYDRLIEYAQRSKIEYCDQLTDDFVSDYKSWIKNQGLSAASVSRSLSALRSLYQYLMSEGVADINPAKEVHNDRPAISEVQILDKKEVELLLSQPDTDVKGIRDKAMLELLYATGIKVSELVSLNVEDVKFSIGYVAVGSGEKQRFIPLYKIAINAIVNYLENSRKILIADPNEEALFVNVSGERMTRQGFWKILKYYADKSKIQKDITPHTLRHSFAAHLLENGADIKDIKEILGHSDISSTLRYAQFLKDKAKTTYIRFHPRA